MTTSQTCAHDACRCTRPYSAQTQAASTAPIDRDGRFCGRRCEEVSSKGLPGDGGCECGHPQCTPQSSADVPPMQ